MSTIQDWRILKKVGEKNKQTRKCEGQKYGVILNWLVQPMSTDEERQARAKER